MTMTMTMTTIRLYIATAAQKHPFWTCLNPTCLPLFPLQFTDLDTSPGRFPITEPTVDPNSHCCSTHGYTSCDHACHMSWPLQTGSPNHNNSSTPVHNQACDDRQDQPTAHASTPPRRSTRIIQPCMPGNISIQAMHHVMMLEAIKVATNSQWTRPIIESTSRSTVLVLYIQLLKKPSHNIKNYNMIQT